MTEKGLSGLFARAPIFHYSSFPPLEAVMGQSGKKQYEKPMLKKVKLDAKCAVLGFCKTTGKIGPGRSNCGVPVPRCFAAGSRRWNSLVDSWV